jgi:hypothetical protein
METNTEERNKTWENIQGLFGWLLPFLLLSVGLFLLYNE